MMNNNNNVSEIDNLIDKFLSLCANFIMEHNGTSVLLAHTHPQKLKLKKWSKMIRIPALSGGILPEKKKICVNGCLWRL